MTEGPGDADPQSDTILISSDLLQLMGERDDRVAVMIAMVSMDVSSWLWSLLFVPCVGCTHMPNAG
jgi:hypothetical protein